RQGDARARSARGTAGFRSAGTSVTVALHCACADERSEHGEHRLARNDFEGGEDRHADDYDTVQYETLPGLHVNNFSACELSCAASPCRNTTHRSRLPVSRRSWPSARTLDATAVAIASPQGPDGASPSARSRDHMRRA